MELIVSTRSGGTPKEMPRLGLGSPSTATTSCPRRARWRASAPAMVVLPVPPFPVIAIFIPAPPGLEISLQARRWLESRVRAVVEGSDPKPLRFCHVGVEGNPERGMKTRVIRLLPELIGDDGGRKVPDQGLEPAGGERGPPGRAHYHEDVVGKEVVPLEGGRGSRLEVSDDVPAGISEADQDLLDRHHGSPRDQLLRLQDPAQT